MSPLRIEAGNRGVLGARQVQQRTEHGGKHPGVGTRANCIDRTRRYVGNSAGKDCDDRTPVMSLPAVDRMMLLPLLSKYKSVEESDVPKNPTENIDLMPEQVK